MDAELAKGSMSIVDGQGIAEEEQATATEKENPAPNGGGPPIRVSV
jgi:hypothetical protein